MSRAYRRRIFAITLTVIAVIGLLIAAVFVSMHEPPEPARLLPECDGILYANLRPLRAFTNFGQKPSALAPEYRNFVDQTGFEFERDLDEIAFAMHVPQDAQHETRYSEVMVGRFDGTKVNDFLRRMSRSRESYANHEVFLIPYEDRIVRVSILSVDMVAASNTGDPAQIDQIIDKFRRSSLTLRGPRLLAGYYHDVPFGSLAWLITGVAPAQAISIGPMAFVRQLFGGGVVVGSARYNGNIVLRAEDVLHDDSAAKDRTEQLQNLLALYKTTESQTRPEHPDPDMESALNSLKVEQKGSRVQVNASIPRSLIEKVFEAPMEAETATPPPAPPAKKPKRHRRR